ncbi:hypothetical protein [Streptomyces pristinaespiralis]|uniref:hypothetical protein n=1 Tax=Streptomyces pristinaespiralis TaxID=38300 RepID=UPI0033C9F08C
MTTICCSSWAQLSVMIRLSESGRPTSRYTQDNVKGSYKDGRHIQDAIDDLVAGRISPNEIPPIRIFERDGKIYSLDNRRLYTFKQADKPVNFRPGDAG